MKTKLRNIAQRYVNTFNTFRYVVELREIEKVIDELLDGQLGQNVLDAGAGSGEMGRRLHLSKRIGALTGIEPFHAALLKDNYKIN